MRADHVARVARPVAALLLAMAVVGAVAVAPAQARSPRVVLAFLPSAGDNNPAPVLARLDARPQLALGLLSATQGTYSPAQMMLDISAGSRTSAAVYNPSNPPNLELVAGGDGSGFIFGWSKALARASTALAEIQPGLLAGLVPGGAAYVGLRGRMLPNIEAVAAADQNGDIPAVSLGPSATLVARVESMLAHRRLVVTGLPTAAKGDAALDGLLRDRRPGDLLLVAQSPPQASAPQLLPIAAAGLQGGNGALTGPTTRLEGIVAGIDVPVTIWRRLGVQVPKGVKGQAIRAEGTRDAAGLKALEARLRVISGRRNATIAALMLAWLMLTLTLGLAADRRGTRAALRIGGLALLWVLPMLLLTGALAPSRVVEVGIVVVGTFALGALTDWLLPWPRGPLLPAAASIVAYAADLAFGSPLIVRSLLGVNPRSGSRFYGLGNELEATLAVLALVAVGALLSDRERSRGAAAVFAAAGLVLGVFVGADQLGADVGGVLTFGSGTAAATLLMLPGRSSRRTLVIAALVPLAAIVGLAALDLLTGGDGHFTRTVLQTDSVGSLLDIAERRYTLALNVLAKGVMPLLTITALLAAGYAIRHRRRLYAPLGGSPSWRAMLIGGLTASAVGTLVNDSGPILLTLGVFVLTCVTAYVRGDPRLGEEAWPQAGRG